MLFTIKLICFTIIWLAILWGINSLIARKPKKVELKRALAYITAVATIGVFGEIFLDTIYNAIVGHPLWEYRILPVHKGYTSSFAIVTWGMYGFYLSMLHDTLAQRRVQGIFKLATIMSIEALLAEALLTLSAKLTLGKFLYYYFPGDLWHVSSFQNIPFYFICAVAIILTVRRFKIDPVFFAGLCAAQVVVLIFLV